MTAYRKGDRVRFSEEGNRRFPSNRKLAGRLGTVASTPHEGTETVKVIWDGRKFGERYHVDFLEPA